MNNHILIINYNHWNTTDKLFQEQNIEINKEKKSIIPMQVLFWAKFCWTFASLWAWICRSLVKSCPKAWTLHASSCISKNLFWKHESFGQICHVVSHVFAVGWLVQTYEPMKSICLLDYMWRFGTINHTAKFKQQMRTYIIQEFLFCLTFPHQLFPSFDAFEFLTLWTQFSTYLTKLQQSWAGSLRQSHFFLTRQ